MFSSESFRASDRPLGPLTTFCFILVRAVKECPDCLPLHAAEQFPQHRVLKSSVSALDPCVLCRGLTGRSVRVASGRPVLLRRCVSLFCVPAPCCFNDCAHVASSELSEPGLPDLVFFLKLALAIHGLLFFNTRCKIFCSVKNAIGNLTGVALNLYMPWAVYLF